MIIYFFIWIYNSRCFKIANHLNCTFLNYECYELNVNMES